MRVFLLRRAVATVITVLLVVVSVFVLVRLVPGDPAQLLADAYATEQDIAELRRAWGLDQPAYTQLLIYLARLARGDFGSSVVTRKPVMVEVAARLVTTMQLVGLAFLAVTVIGVLAGIISAVRPYSLLDNFTMVVTVLGVSAPHFWLALLLMLLFGVKLGWFPVIGGGGVRHLVLPAVALSVSQAAITARHTRSAMLEVLSEDYVRTARAKGLSQAVVVFRHALKNALIPVVTISGLNLTRMIGGSVVIESVFALPGIGKLLVDSILVRDYPVIEGTVLVVAVGVAVVNLAVDLSYAWVDPRIRYD